ncbi:helix-turn-helix transcriptional regulator [Absicoccus porci]|uniref:helix-turn-helix transcriptional regulator n=1 Tax=Absicoccus porci TaxID=2486576 RepID=UPI002A7F26CA|nr:helix-turn-helix transcriptional regulator [Absicoccus porci]MDY4739379.1 helix-turn-helix transcriptional regulator [Absicoccus porci]
MERMTLKAARVNAGMTQEDLAEAIGVHRQTVAKWEENPQLMSIETANKVCKVLNVKFHQIFFARESTNCRKQINL